MLGNTMATVRVDVKPELLKWACDRTADGGMALRERFAKLNDWIHGESKPTLKQLEDFAKSAHVSVGYLFLSKPPVEKLPVSDLRTVGSKGVLRPSPDLLDTIHLCQQRQEWYRAFAEQNGEPPVAFIGSASLAKPSTEVAAEMRRIVDFGTETRQQHSAQEIMRLFVDHVEAVGVLVMVSGVVRNDNTRTLKPDEFRGFALADPLAPLVFVNGSDSKHAQMFTLAHELAHLWLGKSALSNTSLDEPLHSGTEAWCNRVAAEFLVPLEELREMDPGDPLDCLSEYQRVFRVSKAVILRRLLDARLITSDQFAAAYVDAMRPSRRAATGVDFYNTLPVRASKRFVKALLGSAFAGETLYRDAFQLLGVSSVETLKGIAKRVGGE